MLGFYIIAAFFALGFFWCVFVEPNFLLKKELKISLPHSFDELKNLKLVHISDIHFKKIGAREIKLLKFLKEIDPDYLFITGDLFDWQAKDLKEAQKYFKDLSLTAKKGAFGVWGNHDHRNRKFSQEKNILKECGISILSNERIFLEESFYLIGVDDPHLDYDDLPSAMEGTNQKFAKIILAHSPEIFEKIEGKNILVLAGHTHGGQINIPWLVDIFFPLKHNKKYKKGLFFDDGKWMYVNRGIGTTFLPVRFNSPPEIAIIKIL